MKPFAHQTLLMVGRAVIVIAAIRAVDLFDQSLDRAINKLYEEDKAEARADAEDKTEVEEALKD